MNSRSEMRRLAIQNPDALIREIEKLRESVENRDMAFRMTMEAHQKLRTKYDIVWSLLRRLREQFYNWDQQADEKKEAALAVDDFFLGEGKNND